jgi:hypothetical protein
MSTFDAPLEFVPVSKEEARKAFVGDKKPSPGSENRSADRHEQAAESISELTRAWLESLPMSVRPVTLVDKYPRIANRLALLWKKPRQCDVYFENLLVDERGGRQGFPQSVALELVTLKTHYQTVVFPVSRTVWDGNRV